MKRSPAKISLVLSLGLGLPLALLCVLCGWPHLATAAVRTEPVWATQVRYVKPDGMSDGPCSTPDTACQSIQHAVERAVDGDEIRVAAGTYTELCRILLPGPTTITQVVYIAKSIAIRGGYTAANWETPHPATNRTTLDAHGQGRAIYVDGRTDAPAVPVDVTIEGLIITGGDAGGLGGAPLGEDAGGGVYAAGDQLTFRLNQVFGNSAEHGGGLYLGLHQDYGASTLTGNTITTNTARHGGGLYVDKNKASLSDNAVVANSAEYGGGLFVSNSAATVDQNTIHSNSAITAGGGLLLWLSDDAVLHRNTVTSNTAELGGGLYVHRSDATLRGNTVTANAAAEGGGLYLDASDAKLTNHLVADNRSTTSGSGLYVEASTPSLLHSTIVRNHGGDGSGVYVTDDGVSTSDVNLVNTILVDHEVGIVVTAGNRAVLDGTLWGYGAWENTVDWDWGGIVFIGLRNFWDNPDFVDPDAGDYHIGVDSAALDSGVNSSVPDDIDGDPRPQGDGYDLGADETGLAVTKHAEPRVAVPGGQVHYTIIVTNTSVVSLTMTIRDILPDHVTPDGVRTWPAETLDPEEVRVETLVVTVEVGYAGVLTNVVEVTTDKGAKSTYVETSLSGHRLHLPVVMRGALSG